MSTNRLARLVCVVFLLATTSLAPAQTREEKVRGDRQRVESEGFWIYNDLDKAFQQARDTDQSFVVFMLNAGGTVDGRFGTRSHRTEWLGDVLAAVPSAAKRAGFQVGDVILSVDGKTDLMTETEWFQYGTSEAKPGDQLSVQIIRNGQRQTLQLPMQK